MYRWRDGYCFVCGENLEINVPCGIFPIYEIYDKSYKQNIEIETILLKQRLKMESKPETFKKLYHISLLARTIAFGLTIFIAFFIVHRKSKGKYILQSTLSFLQLTNPLGEKKLNKMIQLFSFFFRPFMICSTCKYSP